MGLRSRSVRVPRSTFSAEYSLGTLSGPPQACKARMKSKRPHARGAGGFSWQRLAKILRRSALKRAVFEPGTRSPRVPLVLPPWRGTCIFVHPCSELLLSRITAGSQPRGDELSQLCSGVSVESADPRTIYPARASLIHKETSSLLVVRARDYFRDASRRKSTRSGPTPL